MPWWKKAEYWLTSLKQCELVGCAVNRNTSCSSVGILTNWLLMECCPYNSGPHTKFNISAWLVYNGHNVAHAPQRIGYIISINLIYTATILSWVQFEEGGSTQRKVWDVTENIQTHPRGTMNVNSLFYFILQSSVPDWSFPWESFLLGGIGVDKPTAVCDDKCNIWTSDINVNYSNLLALFDIHSSWQTYRGLTGKRLSLFCLCVCVCVCVCARIFVNMCVPV